MRKPIADQDLLTLIAGAFYEALQAGDPFTAYDITKAVRSASPGHDIAHIRVRTMVHALGAQAEAAGLPIRKDVTPGQPIRYVQDDSGLLSLNLSA